MLSVYLDKTENPSAKRSGVFYEEGRCDERLNTLRHISKTLEESSKSVGLGDYKLIEQGLLVAAALRLCCSRRRLSTGPTTVIEPQ